MLALHVLPHCYSNYQHAFQHKPSLSSFDLTRTLSPLASIMLVIVHVLPFNEGTSLGGASFTAEVDSLAALSLPLVSYLHAVLAPLHAQLPFLSFFLPSLLTSHFLFPADNFCFLSTKEPLSFGIGILPALPTNTKENLHISKILLTQTGCYTYNWTNTYYTHFKIAGLYLLYTCQLYQFSHDLYSANNIRCWVRNFTRKMQTKWGHPRVSACTRWLTL